MKEKLNLKGIVYILIGGTAWGFSGCCAQYLFENYNIDSYWLTSVRLIFSGILCLLITFSKADYRRALTEIGRSRKHLLRCMLYGICGLALCQLSYITGIKYTNAATTTVIQYAGPALIVVAVCIMQKRLPRLFELCALFCAIGGTFLVATHGNPHSLAISRTGLIWCIIAALSVAVYTMMLGETGRIFPIIACNAIAMPVGGAVVTLVFRSWRAEVNLDVRGILAICGIVLVGTVIAFTFYLQAVAEIGPVNTSVIATIEPVSSAVIGFFWLGTRFEAMDIIGFALILSTIIWLTLNDRRTAGGKAAEE